MILLSELQEFFLVTAGLEGKWHQVSKSYESPSLISAAILLTKAHPEFMFAVQDKEGTFLWQGKGTPERVPVTDEGAVTP
ncbi:MULTISPECIES: hypothetical protein [unclassified Dehalobacter]|uniref:hypothetical protein n=1 Tax=unclassified Dehalobacter TaxID=2635733 RepID=UPI00104DA7A9|nr:MULTISPECIES: hypothetical protein [unclassified Dehalobacter]TCX51911.1 hypothetical protein C1I36_06220 [Dehalobacter sp. 14DCB1]TCX52971.1 hypothetical protein C1I38_07900 [Dehalobacter sp. 12DCB1]